MICALLFLSSMAWGQSSGTIIQSFDQRIDSIDLSLREIQSGRPILPSSPTFQGIVKANAITFGDGTTQTTAIFSGASSATAINSFSINATACGVCQATVTFTSPTASDIYAAWANIALAGSVALIGKACILLDGASITNGIGSSTMFVGTGPTGTLGVMTSYREITATTVSAGSHNWCISIFTNTGTVSSSANIVPSFGIVKIR